MESNRSDNRQLLRLAITAVAIAVVFVALVLFLYFWQFHGPLLEDRGAWGQFGDFFGGTLNPLLGSVSVVLLALTLRAQLRVLEESRRQQVLEELQRLLSTISQQLDDMLAMTVEGNDENLSFLWFNDRTQALLGRMEYGEKLRSRKLGDLMRQASRKLRSAQLQHLDVERFTHSESVQDVFRGLVRLDQCLAEFLRRGGDPVIGQLYGTRYDASALLLYTIKLMRLFPQEVFEFPADSMKRMGLSDLAPETSAAVERYRAETAKNGENKDDWE